MKTYFIQSRPDLSSQQPPAQVAGRLNSIRQAVPMTKHGVL